MFERYSEAARRAIFFARRETLQRNSDAIEPCDLLRGLVTEPYPNSALLQHLHENRAQLPESLRPGEMPCKPPQGRDVPLSDSSRKILLIAAKEANSDGNITIDRDHLLRAVMRQEVAIEASLREMGVSLRLVRKESTHRSQHSKVILWQIKKKSRPVLLIVLLVMVAAALWYLHQQN